MPIPFSTTFGTLSFIFDVDHEEEGEYDDNIIMWLVKKGVGEVELIANDIGDYSGKTTVTVSAGSLFGLTPGDYMIDVTASGQWSISIYEQ